MMPTLISLNPILSGPCVRGRLKLMSHDKINRRHNIIFFSLIFRKNKVQIRFSRQKMYTLKFLWIYRPES